MKNHIISDLHHEFGISSINFDDADILIIAGDLDVGTKGIDWLKKIIKKIPVLYILGNHEYYKGSYPKTLHKIKNVAKGSNIHVLENESITFGNITFHGATLWTDFELYGDPKFYGAMCQQRMNDYRRITLSPSYSKLRTIDTYNIHKQSLYWLDKSLDESTSSLNIVITHHAPSLKSIPDELKDDYISAAYASDLENFILKHKPDYWIHGHIHQPAEYTIGNTTILCNPHGYIDEKYNGYNPNLIINL